MLSAGAPNRRRDRRGRVSHRDRRVGHRSKAWKLVASSASSDMRTGRSVGSAARRIRTCNQGIQGPSRFHEAWTISSSSIRRRPKAPGRTPGRLDATPARRPGARRRGLLLGLTPLVSEPSWPPGPGQAWLRIAMPQLARWPVRPADRSGPTKPTWRATFRFRFPAIHPVRSRRLPSVATFFDESPALPLS